jgi:hypothetical protein
VSAITKELHYDYICLMKYLTDNEKNTINRDIIIWLTNCVGTMDGRFLRLQFAPVLHQQNHHT